jgi:5-methylcytosine-specific restriction protein A
MRHRAHLVATPAPGGVMPLARSCRNRFCPELAGSDGWCPAHRRPAFYGSAAMPPGWAKVRAAQLARSPVCEECGAAPASDVHHRVARSAGGTDDPANLLSLCGECHHRATGGMHGAW